MAITFVVAASGASANQHDATTSPNVSSLGSDLLVVAGVGLDNATLVIAEGSTTFTPLTKYSVSAGNEMINLYYTIGHDLAGSGFNVSATGTGNFPGVAFCLFSGVHASPFDNENGVATSSAATTRQPGSITPSENNCVVVTAVQTVYDNAGIACSGFTVPSNGSAAAVVGQGFGIAIAYVIQTSAGAVNPTWSGTGSPDFRSSAIASFKSAAGGGGGGGQPSSKRVSGVTFTGSSGPTFGKGWSL